MADNKMRGGVVKRGATWSYVVRERVSVPLVESSTGAPAVDAKGRPLTRSSTKPRWVGGFRTRGAAVEARAQAMADMGRGTYVAPQDLTVAQWLDRWIDGHAVELKPSTAKSYRDNIDRYLRPALGDERVQTLSPARLSVFFKDLYERGGKGGKALSPRTVELARAVLRRALQDAMLERIIPVNPVVGTKRPKSEKPKHTTWTAELLRTYMDAAGGHPHFALFALAGATGMRRGELCALRWEDIDLDDSLVRVERSVTQNRDGRQYVTPKNHERRKVTIDATTVATLRALKVRQAKDRLEFGEAWEDREGLVFVWENGAPLLPDYVSKVFVTSQAGKGVPRIKLHELRHTHATVLLRAGVPVHIVAKRLGHKDPSVTLRVYADVIPDDDGRAVDVFSKAVFGA